MQIAIVIDLTEEEIHVLHGIARDDATALGGYPVRVSLMQKGLIWDSRMTTVSGYALTEAGRQVLERLFVLSPASSTLLELDVLLREPNP